MSISEARRLLNVAHDISTPNDRVNITLASALVEALAENRPYDGTLNEIQVPVLMLRQISAELVTAGLDEVGLEALLMTIKGRMYGSDLD